MRSVEDRFVYFPTRELVGSPADAELEFSDVHLVTEDDVRLHGWWVPAEKDRGVLLFMHGNAGNISDRIESIRAFHDLDLSVLIFDYRGYGRSEGTPSEQGLYRDAETAWRYLTETQKVPPDRIVMFGRSLGGAVAADLALRHPPKALVLESTFASLRAMAAAAMPLLPIGPFLRTRYDTLGKIGKIAAPVLVLHSREDEVVPFDQGMMIYEAAHEPKAFVELRFGHNEGFILSGATYTDGLDKFLTEHVGKRPERKPEKKADKADAAPAPAAPQPSPFEQEPEPQPGAEEEFTD